MAAHVKHAALKGRLVMVGFGSIGQGVLPLILRHVDLDRDVLSLSGIAAVVWLEGINDFSKNGNASVEAVEAGMKDVVGRIRAKFAGIRIIGATLTSASTFR